jgi:hypothetical protein
MIRRQTVGLMWHNNIWLLAHSKANCAPIHETLICIVAVLVHVLSIMGFLICILHVLDLLLPSVMGVVDLPGWLLHHLTALLSTVHVLHIGDAVRLEVIFVLHDEHIILCRTDVSSVGH